jgi:glycosyltransferase involved in cell wall biosynthesis
MTIMRIGIDARLTFYSQAGISRYIQRLVGEIPKLAPAVEWTIVQSRKEARTLRGGRRINAWTPCHHRLERWALGVELLRHRLDLLHSPDFIPPAFGAGRNVITVHDLNFVHFPQFLTAEAQRYYAGQIEWAVRKADHILADSHHTRQDLLKLLGVPAEKVTTVHLAADEQFRPVSDLAALDRYDLSPGYILFVGTLEPRKNIPTLLTAYRILLDQHAADVPLVLVGRRGWLADDIFDALNALRLDDRVRILEDVVGLDCLIQLYNGAAMLVIPSFYEGFGLPALEAMACETPVIAADRGSLPEIVADAGLLIDPEDADGLAAAIGRLLEDDQLRTQLIRQGKVQAARFSWSETARQTWQVYRQVLQ